MPVCNVCNFFFFLINYEIFLLIVDFMFVNVIFVSTI